MTRLFFPFSLLSFIGLQRWPARIHCVLKATGCKTTFDIKGEETSPLQFLSSWSVLVAFAPCFGCSGKMKKIERIWSTLKSMEKLDFVCVFVVSKLPLRTRKGSTQCEQNNKSSLSCMPLDHVSFVMTIGWSNFEICAESSFWCVFKVSLLPLQQKRFNLV